jgi:hypothetical protein
MAKMGMGGGAGGMAAPQAGGGFLPGIGSQGQYDMVQQLLASAMSSAQQSNSPAAALLAPIATALIGGRAERKHTDARNAEQGRVLQTVFGGAASTPEAQALFEVMNSDATPDFARAAAQKRIEAMIAPKGSGTGRGRASGGSPAALMAEALTAARDPGGPGGGTITPEERGNIDYLHSLRYAPDRRSSSSKPDPDDPLGYGDDDPLRIR